MYPPLPADETERLAALRSYGILDTPADAAFDRLTRLAARLFRVPIALVSLIDRDRQWFKSCYGMDASETPRDVAFCAHAILRPEVTVVADACEDPRFAGNPLVTGPPHIRFYAGAPLVTREGMSLGTLCVIDTVPRLMPDFDRETLADLAAMVVDELELRLAQQSARTEVLERRRAEEALRGSEARFRSLADNASDIVTVMDVAGTIRYESPSIERLLGHKPADLVGKSAFDYVHPDDLLAVAEAFTRAMAGPEPVLPLEFRFRHGDGSWRFLEAMATNSIADPAVAGVVVHSRDVTERRRAEQALRESEARKAAIFETALDAIITMDHEGRVTEFNPAAERIFGYTRAEVLGRPLPELIIPPALRNAHTEGFARYVASGESRVLGKRLELPAMRADGSEILVELAIALIPVDGPPLFTAYLRDITERRRAEERLRLLESVAVHANDAILITEAEPIDQPGPRILYANAAFTETTGYTLEEVLGKTPRILHGPGTDRRALDTIRAALKKWQPVMVELVNHRKDGTPFWVELSIVPVADERGWFTHWVSVQRDVSSRKEAERSLQRAKEQADRANGAKSEFLSRMSHELRTPLNAILGFGQILQMEPLPRGQQESVEQILKGGRHLLDLINEVLDITRIEAGRIDLSLEPVSVREVVSAALELAGPLARQKPCFLQGMVGEASDAYVRGDRQRLLQVLLNLLSNAIKYNRSGGEVRLTCECGAEGGVRIVVHDTGPGIAPEKLDRLFTPFDRLDADRSDVEGTGLGLALSKRLVEAMHGSLTVETSLGEGSAFCVELPREPGPVARANGATSAAPIPAQPDARSSTLLYIEDNPANFRLVERILEHRPGVQLIPAMQGRLGLDLARQYRPDLILLDLHLPDIPGGELLRHLREAPETRDTPVVIVSADATAGQVERLKEAGAQHYLTKPLDVERFLQVVDETLHEGKS